MPIAEETKLGNKLTTKYFYTDGSILTDESYHRKGYSSMSTDPMPRSRMPVGWRYPTPYSMTYLRVNDTTGHWSIDIPGGNPLRIERHGYLAGQYDTANDGPTTVKQYIINDALLKAELKAKNMKLNAGQLIAEARKTTSMVTDTAKLLAKVAHAVKRRDFGYIQALTGWGKPTNVASNAANIWLQYRYGWLPLLSDIHSSLELLADHALAIPRYRATAISFEMVDASRTIGSGSDYACCREVGGIQSSYVRFDFDVDDELRNNINSLGLDNPLNLSWELLPFSFVVDWFLPIGNALGAAEYASALRWTSGTQSNWINTVTRTIALPNKSSAGVSSEVNGDVTFKKLVREVFITPPGVPLPILRNPFPNGPRLMDAIALLWQAFKDMVT